MHFVNRSYINFIAISIKFVPNSPIDNKFDISAGDGIAPNRQEAIEPTMTPSILVIMRLPECVNS